MAKYGWVAAVFALAALIFGVLAGLPALNRREEARYAEDMRLLVRVQSALFNYYSKYGHRLDRPLSGVYDIHKFTGGKLLDMDDMDSFKSKGWRIIACDAVYGGYLFAPEGENICMEMILPIRSVCLIEKELDDGSLNRGAGRKGGGFDSSGISFGNCAYLSDMKIKYLYHMF